MRLDKIPGRHIILMICCLLYGLSASAKEVKVHLFNGQKLQGELLEETGAYIILSSELGQIKILRSAIESIVYFPGFGLHPEEGPPDSLQSEPLNDLVIVHLTNGETASGFLISKSLDTILLRTEWGRLTIPKQQARLVEYINTEYSERGEPVTANLVSGEKLEGYIFHEDRNTITIVTEMGRLTVEKPKLRSLEYHSITALPKVVTGMPPGVAVRAAAIIRERELDSRLDTFFMGYAPSFSDSYNRGLALGYRNRYLLKKYSTFALHAEADLTMCLFTLNKDFFKGLEVPGSANVKGAALVSTLGIGLPLHLFPNAGSVYQFVLKPAFETHIVYTSLQKSYPSFPSLNTEERTTDLRYGLGLLVGLEWNLSHDWKLGISYTMHFIAGEADHNVFSLAIATRLY